MLKYRYYIGARFHGVGLGLAMPINRLLKGRGLGPEEVERLNRAYTDALASLHLVDRNDPIVDIIAKKIIEVGATGISDPEQISKTAIKQLGVF
jgi:hypothetical protein